MAEYCSQYARLHRGVEGFREREVGPHPSGQETIGNVIPNSVTHTTLHPPPNKTNLPSGVSWDSRKRVLHPEITTVASKRAVALESTAGAVTVQDIDGQKSPVERNNLRRRCSSPCSRRDCKPYLLAKSFNTSFYDYSGGWSSFVGIYFCPY